MPTFAPPRLDRAQRELLRYIVENADLLLTGDLHWKAPAERWLLVPIPDHLFDQLAEFESELEDLDEHDGCEPEQDGQSLMVDTWGPSYAPVPKIPMRTISRKRRAQA